MSVKNHKFYHSCLPNCWIIWHKETSNSFFFEGRGRRNKYTQTHTYKHIFTHIHIQTYIRIITHSHTLNHHFAYVTESIQKDLVKVRLKWAPLALGVTHWDWTWNHVLQMPASCHLALIAPIRIKQNEMSYRWLYFFIVLLDYGHSGHHRY